ncbi:titin-like isoform X2 [Malaya genurostris]|uniref:titin-like isoform X2 n=1 Tax=Malaya genurostris TaxID=325434 RepID=UPI0026F39458|nr:titin-like isoform X2 [Malaya genurostris]
MPLYSELYHNFIGNAPVIPTPIISSMPSNSYVPPSYMGVSRSFGNPITATRTPSFTRGYVPKLTPITETPRNRATALSRINSPKYIRCHASPTYQKPRRVINTADIDVSASRYAIRDLTPIRDRYPSSSPTSSISPDPLSSSNISIREQELIERNEQRKARSAINRNRAVVRLNTIRARSKSRGSRGSTERKSPLRADSSDNAYDDTAYQDNQPKPTSWRDHFRDELPRQPKKVEPSKSPGELLLEKHLIREDETTPLLIDEIVYKSPVMKRRATVRRKSTAKIPSFHEICSDINSDKLDDDLNAGELRRRASQIIEDEIAQFQQQLHDANGIMDDQLEERLKSALEQQITDSDIQFPEKKKLKKVRRVRSKPLPKIDAENNVVYDHPELGIKITADSPTIESIPAPIITTHVEDVEECTVYRLPKKIKKTTSGESSPDIDRLAKKTQKKTDSFPVGQNIVEFPDQNVDVSTVEQVETKIGDTTLGELAKRRKAQELQKKIETLSKLSGKKLLSETEQNIISVSVEPNTTVEGKIEQLEPPEEKKLKPPGKKISAITIERKRTQDLEKKIESIAKLGESSDIANIWDQCATATASATNVVQKLPTRINQRQKSEKPDTSLKIMPSEERALNDLEKANLEEQISKAQGLQKKATDKKLVEQLGTKKSERNTEALFNTETVKSLENEDKIPFADAKKNKNNIVLKDNKKTDIKNSVDITQESIKNIIEENTTISEEKPQEMLKTLTKPSIKSTKTVINSEDAAKSTPKPALNGAMKTPQQTKSEIMKPTALENTSAKFNESKDLDSNNVQTQEKLVTTKPKLSEKLTSSKQITVAPKTFTGDQAESPKSVATTSKIVEPLKSKQKQEDLPKPILKPCKKPEIISPAPVEEDFWGNIGTRETIAFARRRQNLERRNQLILLKFNEGEEDNAGVPEVIAPPTIKTMTPLQAQNNEIKMTEAKDECVSSAGVLGEFEAAKEAPRDIVRKKAFEVSRVKLEEPTINCKGENVLDILSKPKSNNLKIEVTKDEANAKVVELGKATISVENSKTTSSQKLVVDEKTAKILPASSTVQPNLPNEENIGNPHISPEAVSKLQRIKTENETNRKSLPNFEEKPLISKMANTKKSLVVEVEQPKTPIGKIVGEDVLKTSCQQNQQSNVESFKESQSIPDPIKLKSSDDSLLTVKPSENLSKQQTPETPIIKQLLAPSISNSTDPVSQSSTNLTPNPVTEQTVPPVAQKKLINPKLSPKEMIKAVAPTIAAAAEKKLAQAQKSETSAMKLQKTTDNPETPKKTLIKPQAADEPTSIKTDNDAEVKNADNKSSTAGGEKKIKVVKKVIRVVKPKGSAPTALDAAAKAEADRLEAERRKQQENLEKMKAKVNQITLNMGVKLEVEIKECAKCQQAALSNTLPAKKQQPASSNDKPAPSAVEAGLTKNKFGVVTNLSDLSAAGRGNRSVGDQVSTGADQQKKLKQQPGKARYSSSSSEVDKDTASETSFSGVEDDWSSDEEEEMANDKPEKKKFDPQKRVKLNVEQMRKCYSKEEKSPIVLVARPRPLWKVKRHGHRHNRKADLTSSSESGDESESNTDQTSSETASTVDASSDINTDSSVNSSRGDKKKKPAKSSSKTSDVGSDIYDNPMVIPLHTEPASYKSSAKDENNNERNQSGSQPNEDDDENNKNAGNHEIRSTSTSSHDSGFYGGGTAPISPKKAMETSYTYAQFQKTGKLTAPATVIPRFRKYNVDDFHFLTVLGKGSFGKVFLAELRKTEYYYAVKCLKKDVVLEDDDVDCTLIERKVLALGTKHPFLCHLFCTFQTDSHLFFVMEYLNGGDLMFHIQQSGRFNEARARFYAAEIVSGLKFLHRKGIVYRDLKLDNVLLDYDGHVRIADFGMCKLEIYLDRLADSFCGTPDYMAPEIIKGQKYNQAVDWWSFGVLVYEMLVGQSPFSGCDEDELFWSICNEIPWFPHFLSKEALKLLKSLLEKDATIRLGCLNTMEEDSDVKYHSFFESIDWQKLERRQLEPPFKPQVRHPLDTQYFDKQFTRERARLTPIDRNILASMNQAQFEGFTYTNPNNTLTKLREKQRKKQKKMYFCPQCGDIKVTYNIF